MIKREIFLRVLLMLFPFISICQERGMLKVKDGELHYKEYGEGSPLLFLNGGPGFSSECYESIANHLKSNKKIILFDQRGTGRSKMRELNETTINISKMVQDIEDLRKHLKIEKWDIIGQSFGGTYAMYYVAKHADRVNKLIITSSFSPGSNDTRRFTYLEEDFKKEDAQLVLEINQKTKNQLRRLEAIDSKNIDEIQRIKNESSERLKIGLRAKYFVHKRENVPLAVDWFINKCSNDPIIVNELVHRSLDLYSIKNILENYKKKVLIIHGENDFIKLAAPRDLHKIFSNSKLELIKDCGHMIWLDQTKKTKKLIFDFLD